MCYVEKFREIVHVEKCFRLFCCKICFVAIYAVLSQNLFCRDLRAFYVEKKIDPKIVLLEKKNTNIRYGSFLFFF